MLFYLIDTMRSRELLGHRGPVIRLHYLRSQNGGLIPTKLTKHFTTQQNKYCRQLPAEDDQSILIEMSS